MSPKFCHPRASSAKTRGFHTKLTEGPETIPGPLSKRKRRLDSLEAAQGAPRDPRRAGKAGNPFQTTQGNRLSCRDQEGRRGSEEAVPVHLMTNKIPF